MAVKIDTAALKHEIDTSQIAFKTLGKLQIYGIILRAFKFAAPSVKFEIIADDLGAVLYVDHAVVAYPRIIGVDFYELYVIKFGKSLPKNPLIRADQNDLLKRYDSCHEPLVGV